MALTTTLVSRSKTSGRLDAILTLAFTGNYPAGGESLDFATKVGFTNKQPRIVKIEGEAGFKYEYDLSTKKVLVRQNGNGVPDVVVTGGQAAGAAVQILPDSDAGVFGKTAATTRTIPGTTFGLTAKPAANTELPAATYPAGVTGDVVTAEISWFN